MPLRGSIFQAGTCQLRIQDGAECGNNISPCLPVLYSMKQPVPSVFLASPLLTHPWPRQAACWSPTTPRILFPAREPDTRLPKSEEEGWIFGRIELDRSKNSTRVLSQSRVLMFMSMVREAFVTSVRW